MEKEKLNLYIKLAEEFEKRCNEICKMLIPLNLEYTHMDSFWIRRDEVCCYGANWEYGELCDYWLDFPISYLTMDNKELQKLINEKVREKNEQIRKAKEDMEQRILKQERKEYERLKAKFG